MKIISTLRLVLISAICALTFTSCQDSSEVLFSISDSEMSQLKNPEVKVLNTGSSSVQVEITFALPVDTWSYTLYYQKKGFKKVAAKQISYFDNTAVYELTNLEEGTEYSLSFSGPIDFFIEYCVMLPIDINLPSFTTLDVKTIYSSPIAVEDGLDTGWTQIDLSGNNRGWDSEYSDESMNYGGVGYAAHAYIGYFFNSSNVFCINDPWLISPKIYLEKGKEYLFEYCGYVKYYNESVNLSVYISKSNNPEDISSTSPNQETDFKAELYKPEQFSFIPKSSGYYYCAFNLNYYGNYDDSDSQINLTGFKVTTSPY